MIEKLLNTITLQNKNNGKTNLNDKQWKSLNELWKLDELYCINGK